VVITALRDKNGDLRGFGKVTRDITAGRRAEEALRRQTEVLRKEVAERRSADQELREAHADLERRVQERVAELSRLNANLAEASRIKDEFLATLSHELRTPLTAIVGWVHMMREGVLSKAQTEKALDVINRNLGTQTRLVEDLLNISRIISGKLRIEPQRIYPAPIIREIIEALKPTTDAKEILLNVELENVGPLRADPARFQQIVWNLLSNALKFTPRRGTITVNLRQVEEQAILSIADTGEGIAPEFLPHVFDRFSQADSSRSRKYGGLGLGLAIVRHLVELHGGTVSAESGGPGQGSTFRIVLPIPSNQQAAASQEAAAENRPDVLKGTQILVIEDEPDTREMLAHALEQSGAQIHEASSAAEAIHILLSDPIDVLVSDIAMPDIDGYNLIHQVRALSTPLRAIPAIALTGQSREEDRLRAIRAGFDAHISKPVAVSELVRTVASLRKVS
jgi:signal transduction histidine kinase/ActR/RegA family two-component response regulator